MTAAVLFVAVVASTIWTGGAVLFVCAAARFERHVHTLTEARGPVIDIEPAPSAAVGDFRPNRQAVSVN